MLGIDRAECGVVNDLLSAALSGGLPAAGEAPGLRWRPLGEGMLELLPASGSSRCVVLSAGIHGDETAPIEVLNALVSDLQQGRLPLAVRLLVILGNPAAMRSGRRFIDEDLNRLFAGRRQGRDDTGEAARAVQIEHALDHFLTGACTQPPVIHLDLHTAIRGSRFERFGLLPWQADPHYDSVLLDWLSACDLEALLINHAPAGTFAYHTSERYGAASCTLELGKVRPFGQNDLGRFAGIDSTLRALVSGRQPAGPGARPRVFRVVGELEKRTEDFELLVSDDVENFTAFPRGSVIARDGAYRYIVAHDEERIVFPNRTVRPGLRAGMMVVETSPATLFGNA